MSVSVVMTVLNGERFIAEAIQSALDQGSCVTEMIVVDDGSTDGTREAVRSIKDARIKLLPSTARGLPAGRNCGVRAASGEWLLFLDADDRLCPGVVNALLDVARLYPQAGFVYGDYERISETGERIGRRHLVSRDKPSGDVLRELLQGNLTVVGAQIIRREAFDRAGEFLEHLKVCDDWHYWCRLAAVTPFRFVPDLRVMQYRIHSSSIMHAKPRPYADFVPAIDAIYSDPLITSRIAAHDLVRMRRRCEASKLGYIATEAVRLHAWGEAVRSTVRAVLRSPENSPRNMARVAGALVGI